MRIVFLPETLDYFNELVTILFEKEYFGFEESALKYVDDLIDQVKNSLHTKIKKPAPTISINMGKGYNMPPSVKAEPLNGLCFLPHTN
jgi:hypothetical protein